MNAYRIIDTADDEGDSALYFRHTLHDAHEAAKSFLEVLKPDVRIQLIEIQTSAKAVIGYLNNEKPKDPQILRTWKLTPRGGLVELDADGKPLEKQA